LNDTTLIAFLSPHWRIHRQRLVFIAQLVVSLVLVRTVSWSRLTNAIDGPGAGGLASAAYRRIQRLFGWAGFSQENYCRLVLSLVGDRKLTLVMDRTDWKLGQTPLNILILGLVWQGIAIPLVWIPSWGSRVTPAWLNVSPCWISYSRPPPNSTLKSRPSGRSRVHRGRLAGLPARKTHPSLYPHP
jgi:hypothetical protein